MAMRSCAEDIKKKQENLRKDIYVICYAISLIRKPKKCLKRRANFRVASFQPVIIPTSICLFKVNFKKIRTRCKI